MKFEKVEDIRREVDPANKTGNQSPNFKCLLLQYRPKTNLTEARSAKTVRLLGSGSKPIHVNAYSRSKFLG